MIVRCLYDTRELHKGLRVPTIPKGEKCPVPMSKEEPKAGPYVSESQRFLLI